MGVRERLVAVADEVGRTLERAEHVDALVALERRLNRLEARVDTLIGRQDGNAALRRAPVEGDALPPPVPKPGGATLDQLAAAVDRGQQQAARQGHVLGPWTTRTSGDRHASCRRPGCKGVLHVTPAAQVQGMLTRCQGGRLPSEIVKPKLVRRYQPKPCERCTRAYTPSGPRQVFCGREDCAPPAARAAGGRA